MDKITVIGAGSWGTALAHVIAKAGRDVMLWGRNEDVINDIKSNHTNTAYLGDIPLAKGINATTDLEMATKHGEAVLLVVPAQHLRKMMQEVAPFIAEGVPILLCSKGIELETGCLMSHIAEQELPNNPYIVLSGPTFAHEVAKNLPSAVTLATPHDIEIGKTVAAAISSNSFRPYVTSDPIGAEIGGAVKNVIAVACGIVHGSDLGENARVAIMTRGMAEIKRMGKILGAKPETFLGLSGMGDLTLTCNSMTSRNFSLGVQRGKGESLNEILAKRSQVTEGVATASAVLEFARKNAIEMPICAAVNETLHNGVSVHDTIKALMSRPLTQEDA